MYVLTYYKPESNIKVKILACAKNTILLIIILLRYLNYGTIVTVPLLHYDCNGIIDTVPVI